MLQTIPNLHDCDNCEAEWADADLEPIADLSSRIDPGGTVPSGQCPGCGSLCYPALMDVIPDAAIDDFNRRTR
jgi:hypothetical protein